MTKLTRAYAAAGMVVSMIVIVLGTAQAAEQASVTTGARTWANNCDRCHNMRDPGDFDFGQWRVIVNHMRIRAGLTGDEARDVLEFLRQSSGSSTQSAATTRANALQPAASTAGGAGDGRRIYEGTCIACHGPDGKGAVAGVPDLTAEGGALSETDSVLLAHIENGFQSPGSTIAMPPKGGDQSLTTADVEAVLRYLHSNFGH